MDCQPKSSAPNARPSARATPASASMCGARSVRLATTNPRLRSTPNTRWRDPLGALSACAHDERREQRGRDHRDRRGEDSLRACRLLPFDIAAPRERNSRLQFLRRPDRSHAAEREERRCEHPVDVPRGSVWQRLAHQPGRAPQYPDEAHHHLGQPVGIPILRRPPFNFAKVHHVRAPELQTDSMTIMAYQFVIQTSMYHYSPERQPRPGQRARSISIHPASAASIGTPTAVAKRCLIVARLSSRPLMRKNSSTRSVP